MDVNDNAPVYVQSRFEIYINENEISFPYRFRVEAFDSDLSGKLLVAFLFIVLPTKLLLLLLFWVTTNRLGQ